MGAILCQRYFVSGRVQGVFFRANTATEARRLGLAGWAINLPDGRVEVLVRGSEHAVQAIGSWLRQGIPPAQVDDLETIVEDPDQFGELIMFRSG
jgi:acylphosphatase